MSIQRSSGMDRDTAEHLVAGEGVGPVASVLRAAAAPTHRDELAGEAAAVAAFHEAANAVPSRPPRFRRAVAKALTIKAAIVVAVAGSTGIVLAASEGALPVPWSDAPAAPSTTAPSTTTATTEAPAPATQPHTASVPAPNPSGPRTSDSKPPAAAADPAIVGLCNAYTAPGADKNLDNPAFRALVEAAGGKGEVARYCQVAEAAQPTRPSVPGNGGNGSGGGNGTGGGNGPGTGRPGVAPPTPPRAEPPGKQGKPDRATTEPAGRTTKKHPGKKTPVTPAPGAATAVPPSGAEPPSAGG